MTQRTGRVRPRQPWAMLVLPAVAGIPAGILWWLLAPGGLNLITRDPVLGDGAHPQVWLPRDLTLAGVLVFAGCLLAVFLADKKRADPQASLVLGLAGGLCGAVVAWQVGVFSATFFGPEVDATANASIAFSLRALPVLLLWPAATAISVFVLELMHLLGNKDHYGTEGARHAAVGPVK
ncbi:MAG: hypothetical protein ABWY04_04450 [Arthrobacter sp.]